MNREFLEAYNRELKILYERAREFADEFPGVAERLGGLIEGNFDPGLAGLLEGAAFMAARVQLKLRSEFSEFTSALLELLLPSYLAPVPSVALVQAVPAYEDANLAAGARFPTGSYIDAVYVERDRRITCRYRLASELALWPLRLEAAQYHASPAPLQALGLEVAAGTAAGLTLSFRRRTTDPGTDREGVPPPGAPVGALGIETLPVHLVGTMADAVALYEALFASCRRITLRYLDSFGDPKFRSLPLDALEQIGFGEGERLFGEDVRVFSGFELLREFAAFPQKFLGFRLNRLRAALAGIESPAFDLIFEFDSAAGRLASVVNPSMFALYACPAANIFQMNCSRIPVSRGEHEHQIVPDRSRWLDFEAHRVVDVFAHYPGRTEKVRVFPLYSLPSGGVRLPDALFYSLRRMPRRQTSRERRYGQQSSYTGTELFLSLYEPAGIDDEARVRELSIRVWASNRHLTEHLPVGEAGADFNLVDNTSIKMRCLAGPTPPRESIVHFERRHRESASAGSVMWRLINLLSLSHFGLTDRGAETGAGGLRELLGLFSDLSESVSERRLRGIRGIRTRPIVRRLRQPSGFNAARGMEVTVTFDERAFEGTGIFLLGAVLDRFFAEYASLNSFTETVVESVQRGIVKRWPPRSGSGRLL
ncbi:type VI secretion system baseplate subunit TssF [Propylenella binzhouense]|uniref:Type VI secretion system baseplate subunit TssF n=1 Tax=Propylenella binzhouense TaxID=2555902 RepID=A0A964T8W1_9HYPH|nr:type VI secretion system baseplate subunit TssF [Propylenella binzhouense]MYZ49934.1 type VI secretion system baseplate subunit TssF [Propylenella binzhouense]